MPTEELEIDEDLLSNGHDDSWAPSSKKSPPVPQKPSSYNNKSSTAHNHNNHMIIDNDPAGKPSRMSKV